MAELLPHTDVDERIHLFELTKVRFRPPSTINRVSETEKPVASFESGLTELESVVKQLESGDLPLEQALSLFEKGMLLSESCRKQLEEAETKIEMLIKKNDKIQAEPFKPGKA
jgi:exodeoxyribonuclease VII small subunit